MNIQVPQGQSRAQLRQSPVTNFRVRPGQREQLDVVNPASQYLQRKQQSINRRQDFIEKDFSNKADRFVIENKAFVAQQSGENAAAAAAERRQKLREQLENLSSSERYNDDDRAVISQILDRKMLDYDRAVIPHEYSQLKDVQNKTYEQFVRNKADQTIELSGDVDNFVKLGLNEVAEAARQDSAQKFGQGSPNVDFLGESYVDKTVSSTVLGALELHKSAGNIIKVREIMEKASSKLLPEDLEKANDLVRQAEDRNTSEVAYQISVKAAEMYPNDEVKQEEFIRINLPDGQAQGKTYREAMQFSRANVARNKRVEEKRMENIKASVYENIENLVEEGGSLTSEMLKDLSPEDKSSAVTFFNKLNRRENVVTVPDTYNSLEDMYRNDPEQFKDLNLFAFRDKLSKTDFNDFRRRKRNLVNRELSQEARMAFMTDKTVSDIVKDFVQNTLKNESSETYTRVGQVASQIFEGLQGVEGMTPQELRSRMKRALIDNVKMEENRGFFRNDFLLIGGQRVEDPWWRTPYVEGEVGELNVDQTPVRGEIPAHPSFVDGIQRIMLKQKNRAATREEIMKYIQKAKERGVDVSRPYRGR